MNPHILRAHEGGQGSSSLSVSEFPPYLTIEEEDQISQQFQRDTWGRNRQVMWSGVPRELAQEWADE
ncbi:hypothetical protein PAAG_12340 [Paracoccidioides lutzii Pb01]|uniref:Uncharacterized protein n=1 Tax=Paracoccidioides lutzii (strain ATCC MYA-826 / Pb01) TaxID=502779 RepID=A0A0A2V3K9_PARBA|nr:hypothetical protein PAAG_12340 [Paracoccidioides lutzii Pb01]KGQ00967.1 hypothetical protein PAAG_12340 [Paracoccidioides lutzii Pb01]